MDSYRHKGLRKSLVETLVQKGISDNKVLDAINRVPRHLFIDEAFVEHAYVDKAFPIGEGQTISQPYTVAKQTALLKINTGDRVLEIGTGSGYQASVLLELKVKLFTIERQKVLYEKTRTLLPKLGYRPQFFCGDGTKGLPKFGPFDKIIVTAGAPVVPKDLIDQLNIGGILVIPVGDDKSQKMIRITKTGDKQITKEEFGNFAFVPLIGKNGWNNKNQS